MSNSFGHVLSSSLLFSLVVEYASRRIAACHPVPLVRGCLKRLEMHQRLQALLYSRGPRDSCLPRQPQDMEDAGAYGWNVKMEGLDWQRFMANKNKEIKRLNGVRTTTLNASHVSQREPCP